VEANALHGGRIPARDTATVVGTTLLSNGFGASVGLEAAYAQAGGGLASLLGQRIKLRRSDLPTLMAAGAGAAVSAAFGAPLAGAFYAFEVVLGAYSTATVAPVMLAALAAAVLAR
ncbi:chloride channel protein, partial [Proteus mirabilis]|uniref:chloride channel protein n=1 Tax=Proteus mirabilis TaxID=584 RepID=UPI0013D5FA3C